MDPTGIGHIQPAAELQPATSYQRNRAVRFNLENDDNSIGPGTTISGSGSIVEITNTNDAAKKNMPVLLGLKMVIGGIFFLVVLISSVMSKLTLVSLTDTLRNNSHFLDDSIEDAVSKQSDKIVNSAFKKNAITVYWQLLIILLVPNCITFLRCLFFGFLGKTKKSYPWPRGRAVLLGLIGSVIEVAAMSVLVFLVLSELSPGISIMVLSGVFLVQTPLEIKRGFSKILKNCNVRNKDQRDQYETVDGNNNSRLDIVEREPLVDTNKLIKAKNIILTRWEFFFEHWLMKSISFFLQLAGVVGLIVFWAYRSAKHSPSQLVFYCRPLIGLPLVLVAMSVIWSDRFQEEVASSYKKKGSARYKSSLLNSFFRICLYPLITYVIFRYASSYSHEIDPWCLHHSCSIDISGTTRNVMIVHIVMSFVGYVVTWISCTMTLSQLSVGLPLLLSTPISVFIYYTVQYTDSPNFFPPFMSNETNHAVFDIFLPVAPILSSLIWFGQILAVCFFICTKTNIILAKDEDMFLTPHYDSIFLEQHIILNRKVRKWSNQGKRRHSIDSDTSPEQRNPRMIFICSTMYHENTEEMKQMLVSINRVALHFEKEREKDRRYCDRYESHIFFDGAINVNQFEDFGLQLLSLIGETLNIKLTGVIKLQTPYGYRLGWKIGSNDSVMPFYIHFKDKNLVKPKKRWSQVMYMNYVLNHRIIIDGLNADDTFILTTDADIDFTADSAVVLLDMLAPNRNVAAVCARTHPKGSGPIYWYQQFDYAIGHWFQKPAEHILGSVLCSPGCFSVFRCSALKLVLEEYSTEVNGALEFLMKDMGEDRWLCTLLIKQGLRLEYCAISEDQTYCPTEFDEFFKQRRRWIPSTVANLMMLVSESRIITRGNDSISILFILFQAIMIFSTSIAPATVILFISAGLQTFSVPTGFTISFLFILAILYGIMCLTASPQTQLDIAKLLTFFFSLVMAVAIIGIFKDLVDDLAKSPGKMLIGPPDCSGLQGNDTEKYDDCMKGRNFAIHYNNSVYHQFTLPVSVTVVYIGALAGTFLIAGILHLPEIHCLMHSIWFLLGLPSGYLLLLIYSAANLCDRSWGTREQNTGADEGLWGWRIYVIKAWKKLMSLRCCLMCYVEGKGSGATEDKRKKDDSKKEKDSSEKEESEKVDGASKAERDKSENNEMKSEPSGEEYTESSLVKQVFLEDSTKEWLLKQLECEEYLDNFESHGYTNKYFIADMTIEDFETIGIDKLGFRLRLEKAIKSLPKLPFEAIPPEDVQDWLTELKLEEEYMVLFHHEGYKWAEDISNLKRLDECQLKSMGIIKRCHLQRLVKALDYLLNPPVVVDYSVMDQETMDWLRDNECEAYADKFVNSGYTNKHFIAGMKAKDMQAIGVDKRGFVLRLEKAAKLLPSLPIQVHVPDSVKSWLRDLELVEYTQLFHREGYKKAEDIINLKELDEVQLRAMGITKKAHLQRLQSAMNFLAKPLQVELNKKRTKGILDRIASASLEAIDKGEAEFWKDLINRKLKPVSQKFTHIKDVQKSLESLRNSVMGVLLLVNVMWLLLLVTLQFSQLERYGIDPRAFEILFLAVYGFIIVVQFLTMVGHRAVTLIHYLGRVKPREVLVKPWEEQGFHVVSVA